MTQGPTGQELMDEMAKQPTLDEFFVQNPQEQSDDDLRRLVGVMRDERALFIAKGERARKEKEDD